MHDIWNPWHGCVKCSEGCDFCYMYYLDRVRDKDGSEIYRTKAFNYPLRKDKQGNYKIKSGEMIRVCMTSDFFLEEADIWRDEAWDIIAMRPDVKFYLLTKRPERVKDCLPKDWGKGWENVIFNITCENQKRADERIPYLLELPFKHKGIMCAPLLDKVDLEKALESGQIEQVVAGGENYDGARQCDFEWVKALSKQCRKHNVTFCFIETGTVFIKDKKRYTVKGKATQSEMAYRSGVSFEGKPIVWNMKDSFGFPLQSSYIPYFRKNCFKCGSRPICNGCSNCGKCEVKNERRDF